MASKNDQRIKELLERRETCSGAHVERRLRQLGISVSVFWGNYRELAAALEHLSQPESLGLRAVENRTQHRRVLQNVVRLLHNLLASVKSLVDHSRNVVTELADAELKEKYTAKVTETFDVPEHQFLQKLRNFALHWKLPPIVDRTDLVMTDTPGRATVQMSVNLDAEQLLEWDAWNAGEKEFIRGWKNDQVPLASVVDKYSEAIRGFYEWLISALGETHKASLEELVATEEELHNLLENRNGDRISKTS